jgi:dsDNA-binding SOS-regulon protein
MSPVDSYYQVLDYINELRDWNELAPMSNEHELTPALAVLLRLANQAEHQE